MRKSNNTKYLEKGTSLFDTYLDAKKALAERIKDVLEIMARCKMLDVIPSDATSYVAQKIKDVANHQWQYNAGHETIYCQHAYSFRHGIEKCTVKIPVKYLGMTNDEIYAANREAAIASLEQAKEELDQEMNRVTEPINKKKAKIDEKIAALKAGNLDTAETDKG